LDQTLSQNQFSSSENSLATHTSLFKIMSFSHFDPTYTFPHADLTLITGKPSFASVQVLKRELIANAISVHSAAGSGQLGHAVIVLGIPAYNVLAGANNGWTDPPNPVPTPAVPDNATSAHLTTAAGPMVSPPTRTITVAPAATKAPAIRKTPPSTTCTVAITPFVVVPTKPTSTSRRIPRLPATAIASPLLRTSLRPTQTTPETLRV
jgi:hypothetical protein